MDRMNAQELTDGLSNFCGSERVYKHLAGLKFTEGVHFLAEQAGAYWLLDVIASYQHVCKKDRMLRDFQSWTLTVNLKERSATVKCERDSGDPKPIVQEIEFTDFPPEEIKLYVRDSTILLPSEY